MDDATTLILFPRYTSLAGATSFASAPLNVRGFSFASLLFWRGGGVNLTDLTFTVEGSQDLKNWETLGTTSPNDDIETALGFSIDREWLRVVAAPTGTNPTVCVWAMGQFTKRVGV